MRNKETAAAGPRTVLVRIRHRAPLLPATFDGTKVIFEKPIKRIAPGQSVVFYDDEICLGGGIVF